MRELTAEARRIAKERLKLTDKEIDSVWFRIGYSLGSIEPQEHETKHTHEAFYEDGKLTRICKSCGLDLADDVHFRVDEKMGVNSALIFNALKP